MYVPEYTDDPASPTHEPQDLVTHSTPGIWFLWSKLKLTYLMLIFIHLCTLSYTLTHTHTPYPHLHYRSDARYKARVNYTRLHKEANTLVHWGKIHVYTQLNGLYKETNSITLYLAPCIWTVLYMYMYMYIHTPTHMYVFTKTCMHPLIHPSIILPLYILLSINLFFHLHVLYTCTCMSCLSILLFSYNYTDLCDNFNLTMHNYAKHRFCTMNIHYN